MLFTSINSTSTTSWCPKGNRALIALGSASGTLDASFDTKGELGIYELKQDGIPNQARPASLLNELKSQSRFTNVCWGMGTDDLPFGLIATAIEGGSLNLWDAGKILDRGSDIKQASLFSAKVSDGSPSTTITSLEFNPSDSGLLAVARGDGEINVWDLSAIKDRPSVKSKFYTCAGLNSVSWNRQTPYIIGASSYNGDVSVWDVRKPFKIMSLKDPGSRLALSSIAWDLSVPTRVVIASGDDTTPFMYSWDMRNPNLPENIFKGHEKGILSISWCEKDPGLLASCSKDARVLLWDTESCCIIGELERCNNWAFKVSWSPTCPNFIASSSFDGTVKIHDIISREQYSGNDASMGQYYQNCSYTLQVAPKWLKVPSGASFTCGNNLLSFSSNSRSIILRRVCADFEISSRVSILEKAYMENDRESVIRICSNRLDSIDHIPDPTIKYAELYQWMIFMYATTNDLESDIVKCLYSLKRDTARRNGDSTSANYDNLLEALDKLGYLNTGLTATNKSIEESDPSVAASKCVDTSDLYTGMDLAKKIQNSLCLGDIETATRTSIEVGNFVDAFTIASLHGPELLNKVMSVYLDTIDEDSCAPHTKVLKYIAGNKVHKLLEPNSGFDISSFESRSMLVSAIRRYVSNPDERSRLYSHLASRLLEVDGTSKAPGNVDYTTLLCYTVSKDPKILDLWADTVQLHERLVSQENDGALAVESLCFDSIQSFMEKVFVYNALVAPIAPLLESRGVGEAVAGIFYRYAKCLSDMGFPKLAYSCLDIHPMFRNQDGKGNGSTDALAGLDVYKLKRRIMSSLHINNCDQQAYTSSAEPVPPQTIQGMRRQTYSSSRSTGAPYPQANFGYHGGNPHTAPAAPYVTEVNPRQVQATQVPQAYGRTGGDVPVANHQSLISPQHTSFLGKRPPTLDQPQPDLELRRVPPPVNYNASQTYFDAPVPSSLNAPIPQMREAPNKFFPMGGIPRSINTSSAMFDPMTTSDVGFNDPPQDIFDVNPSSKGSHRARQGPPHRQEHSASASPLHSIPQQDSGVQYALAPKPPCPQNAPISPSTQAPQRVLPRYPQPAQARWDTNPQAPPGISYAPPHPQTPVAPLPNQWPPRMQPPPAQQRANPMPQQYPTGTAQFPPTFLPKNLPY